MTLVLETKVGNESQEEYHGFIEKMNARFSTKFGDGKTPLFRTDIKGLFDVYLNSFSDPAERQYHNCSCCHRFISRFGGLVYVNEEGAIKSAIWDEEDAPEQYERAVSHMTHAVERAKIVSPFMTSESEIGEFTTGVWSHFALRVPKQIRYVKRHLTAGQAMAERREDFKNVMRAMAEFDHQTVKTALTILRTDALYRSEKVLGAAEWLDGLYEVRKNRNKVWEAIAMAPAGFCHPRSSMIGTLLEDIQSGMDFDRVAKRFKEKMHPLQYQRPQAAPASGAIKQAEKLFQEMNLGASLRRRFARLEEIDKFWTPAPKKEEERTSIFGHLEAKDKVKTGAMNLPAQTVTWKKFLTTVLPGAERIQFTVPAANLPLAAIVTAADPDAEPLLMWDHAEKRNPFSSYVWHGGSTPGQFNLKQHSTVDVVAITHRTHQWYGGNYPNQGEGVIFILDGCKETRYGGLALFPEILRSEVKSVRSVIEAHSNVGKIEGIEDASACGLLLDKNGKWQLTFRVTAAGHSMDYKIDRWD